MRFFKKRIIERRHTIRDGLETDSVLNEMKRRVESKIEDLVIAADNIQKCGEEIVKSLQAESHKRPARQAVVRRG